RYCRKCRDAQDHHRGGDDSQGRGDHQPALGAGCIDQRTERRGRDHAGIAADRHYEADLGRRPTLPLQEHAEERPKAITHVGHEEIERVEREQRRHHLGPPFGPAPFAPASGRKASSVIWSGETPMALTSITVPSGVTRLTPRTATVCPGCKQACRRSASGGGRRRMMPLSSSAPLTSPRLPCNAAAILPLMVCWVAQRSGPQGGPLSIPVVPVAWLVTGAASPSGSPSAVTARMVNAAPGPRGSPTTPC